MSKPPIAITYLKLDDLVQQSDAIFLAEGAVPGKVVCQKSLFNLQLYSGMSPEGSTFTIREAPLMGASDKSVPVKRLQKYSTSPAAASRQILFLKKTAEASTYELLAEGAWEKEENLKAVISKIETLRRIDLDLRVLLSGNNAKHILPPAYKRIRAAVEADPEIYFKGLQALLFPLSPEEAKRLHPTGLQYTFDLFWESSVHPGRIFALSRDLAQKLEPTLPDEQSMYNWNTLRLIMNRAHALMERSQEKPFVQIQTKVVRVQKVVGRDKTLQNGTIWQFVELEIQKVQTKGRLKQKAGDHFSSWASTYIGPIRGLPLEATGSWQFLFQQKIKPGISVILKSYHDDESGDAAQMPWEAEDIH